MVRHPLVALPDTLETVIDCLTDESLYASLSATSRRTALKIADSTAEATRYGINSIVYAASTSA